MERQEVRRDPYREYPHSTNHSYRIVENTHLLDATEIFRKLNVHKKVRAVLVPSSSYSLTVS